jgi:hypothetical protein
MKNTIIMAAFTMLLLTSLSVVILAAYQEYKHKWKR